MSNLIPLFAAALILVSLLHIGLKVLVAHSRCSGGAPLFDGVIFPPLFLGFGSHLIFRYYKIAASGIVVGLVSLVVVIVLYQIAWKSGGRGK